MEIKPQDYRLGNIVTIDNPTHWANLKGVPLIIRSIELVSERDFPNSSASIGLFNEQRKTYSQFSEFIKPIELTPEWLEKCHAIKRTDITSEIIFGTYRSLEIVKDTDGYRLHLTSTTGGNISLRKIKYLHDLQNSYYGVFGQELAIDNKSL